MGAADHGGEKLQANGTAVHAENRNYLNHGEDEQMDVYGYRRSAALVALTWALSVLTVGALPLILHWRPDWRLYLTCHPCPLRTADHLLVIDSYQGKHKSYFVKAVRTVCAGSQAKEQEASGCGTSLVVQLKDGRRKDTKEIRVVHFKKLLYVWDDQAQTFVSLAGLDSGVTTAELHGYKGISVLEQSVRRRVYGLNEIRVAVQSVLQLVLLELANPFYVFQAFTLAVWIADGYLYYTAAIVLMSTFGVASSVVQTRRNQHNLHDTVSSVDVVTVCRGQDAFEDIPSTHLVPGDVIVIPEHGCEMACDAALLTGNCIVNESMLTGESVPVTKTPVSAVPGLLYHIKEDSGHTLFCGTKVLQTRTQGTDRVRAVVLRTGYLTSKGELVRAILYPPPADFRFDRDSYRFIGILAVIALAGLIYTVVTKSSRGVTIHHIVIKALDIITIVVPPALPAAMTVGKMYAQSRLKNQRVYCINSRVINVAGALDCVCFDKTGTLTEDGLDLWGVLPVEGTRFGLPLRDMSRLQGGMLHAMASCHSLTLIDGQVAGDPLDVKMFEATGWRLDDADETPVVRAPDSGGVELCVEHQFQFSSSLQRMCVAARSRDGDLVAYVKGSPEILVKLSRPETMPPDLSDTLVEYTARGYRVIALGSRALDTACRPSRMLREQMETELTFLGLVVLENRVKPNSAAVVAELRAASVNVTMITGDNLQTAVSVARECGIVSPSEAVIDVMATEVAGEVHVEFSETVSPQVQCEVVAEVDVERGVAKHYRFAMTGGTWELLRVRRRDLVPRIVARGAVFARMTSEQKRQLIEELKDLGYCVAMCGDGANDCGALRAAHAGVSLSEAESSVAAPFTSREADIGCVTRVLREGRAALSTSFGAFRFMAAYSLAEFTSAVMLYDLEDNLADLQFLFIDVALVVNFAFFFGRTEAYPGPLVPRPPPASLLSVGPLLSLGLHLGIVAAIQQTAFRAVRLYDWFVPFVEGHGYAGHENFAVFCVSLFQYLGMAVVFSQGKPYRKPLYTNRLLTGSLVLMTAVCIYLTISPAAWICRILELLPPEDLTFRVSLVGLGVANLFLTLVAEMLVVEWLYLRKVKGRLLPYAKKGHEIAEEEMLKNPSWPPLVPRDGEVTTTKL